MVLQVSICLCRVIYTRHPVFSSLPELSLFFNSKAKMDVLKEIEMSLKSILLCLSYQTAATPEQYFNKEKQSSVFHLKDPAISRGVR